jgi:hypothetical protein
MTKIVEFEKLKEDRRKLCDKLAAQPDNPKLKAELDLVNSKIKELKIDVNAAYSAIKFSK